MKLLLDTHLLIWAASARARLSPALTSLITDLQNQMFFSAMSIWEIVIKSALNRPNFNVDAALLRRGRLDRGYEELPITSAHGLAVAGLPPSIRTR